MATTPSRVSASEKRVLITGSRSWTDVAVIREALRQAYAALGPFTLVSGACPKGADAIAERLARKAGMKLELHPADWDRYGKSAGFKRNAEMVALGADLVYAFIRDHSAGASHTARLAEEAGLILLRYEA